MVRIEERNGWSDIQHELLEEILGKLTLFDYLKCRRVCQSWRHIVDNAVATKGTICSPAPQFPFLMLLPKSLGSATLVDMTQEDTSYTMAPPRTWKHGYAIGLYSVEGWIILFRRSYYHKNQVYDLVLMFYNPVSGEEFELPPLLPFSGKDFTQCFVKLVFSSAPTSSGSFVVACATATIPYDQDIRQQLAFCKVADESWTLIPTDEYGPTLFNQFVILDWKLYAMQSNISDFVVVFNLRDSNIITSERLVMLNPNAIPMALDLEVEDGVQYCTKGEVCMTRDGDELLFVLHLTKHVMHSGRFVGTKGFRIFKLDICGPRWIEVDDLGDRVLLIDDTRIQVISAKEINLPEKLSGGNFVLFSIFKSLDPDLGVFSLKDKSFKPLSLHLTLQDSSGCLWFMPSLW